MWVEVMCCPLGKLKTWSVQGTRLASKCAEECFSSKSVVPESPTAISGDVIGGIAREAIFFLII